MCERQKSPIAQGQPRRYHRHSAAAHCKTLPSDLSDLDVTMHLELFRAIFIDFCGVCEFYQIFLDLCILQNLREGPCMVEQAKVLDAKPDNLKSLISSTHMVEREN